MGAGFDDGGDRGILLAPNVGLRVDALTLFIVDARAPPSSAASAASDVAGGLIIGVAQSFALNFLQWGGRWSTASVAIPAVILFVALLALPEARLEAGRLVANHRVPRVPGLGRAVSGLAAVVLVAALVAEFGGLDTTNLRRLTLADHRADHAVVGAVDRMGGQISLAQIPFVGVRVRSRRPRSRARSRGWARGTRSDWWWRPRRRCPSACSWHCRALRLQGLYLALASMAFAVMAIPLFFAQPEIFGAAGRKLATPPSASTSTTHNFLVLAAVVFALVGLFVVVCGAARSVAGWCVQATALPPAPPSASTGADQAPGVRARRGDRRSPAASSACTAVGSPDFPMLVGIPSCSCWWSEASGR